MRTLMSILAVILMLCVPVNAIEAELVPDADVLKESLTAEQQELLGDTEPLSSAGFSDALMDLLSKAVRDSGKELRKTTVQCAMLLAICLLCGLADQPGSGGVRPARFAGVLAITAVCTNGLNGMLRLGNDTVQELTAFIQLLFPVLVTASAASGAMTTAPSLYAVTVLFSDLLLSLMTGVLIPAVQIYLALAAADCVLGDASLKKVCELVIWGIKTVLKSILYAFTGFLTVTQVISGTADSMTTKATRLTISGMVPVVGSILSDASETVLVSASLIRNSLGVFGMLAVLAVCILPFLRIGIWYLSLKVTAAVSGIVVQDTPVRMVTAAAESMGLLLGMTGTAALLMLISVVCTMKTVGI